ncbi:PTS sugar transporter subunit IIC, partial [Clostridioides difficile]
MFIRRDTFWYSDGIGAATPPDVVTGGVLGTAFAILSGNGAEVALAVAVPVAVLA